MSKFLLVFEDDPDSPGELKITYHSNVYAGESADSSLAINFGMKVVGQLNGTETEPDDTTGE